jgi:hypothetical protein
MNGNDNVSAIPAAPISFTSVRLQGASQKPVAGFRIRSQGSDRSRFPGFVLEAPITKQNFPNRLRPKGPDQHPPSVPGERDPTDCAADSLRTIV